MEKVEDCLFCKIIDGKIPSKKIYEDEDVYAFEDIHPQSKIHWLFIHKNHTRDVSEMVHQPKEIISIFNAITLIAKDKGLEKTGYRIVTNLGPDACQTVFHTHFHLLAGEQLKGFGA